MGTRALDSSSGPAACDPCALECVSHVRLMLTTCKGRQGREGSVNPGTCRSCPSVQGENGWGAGPGSMENCRAERRASGAGGEVW